jgi:peptidoglycan/xylan/chitin deacetylase (PgdA/CDA1 family)
MNLRSYIGNARRSVLSWFHRRVVPLGARGPIVTFSFDDFPRTALTVGGEILESFGARATYYVAMSLMNTVNNLGEQFRDADLESVLKDGHELASHTFSHFSARRVGYRAFERDVEGGERAIQERLGVWGSGNFAYPYGDVTLRTKKEIGSRLVSCRGTCGGLNVPDVDLNLLRANSLYGDLDRLADPERLILENEQRKGWLIFYSHDVTSQPSPFGCTPRLLEAVCSFAAAHNTRFMTVAQVMRDLGQESTPRVNRKLRGGDGLPCASEISCFHNS